MSISVAEEPRLLRLLFQFDRNLATDYVSQLENLKKSTEQASMQGRLPKLLWKNNADTQQPVSFRTKFDSPIYFVLSHPISRFRRTEEKYGILWSGDEEFCAKVALIPMYLVNLNTYSVFKQWKHGAKLFFDPTAEPIPEQSGEAYWKVANGSTGPQFSSLNFVLKFDGDPTTSPKQVRELLFDYFRYIFWSFPKHGFSNSTHILHDGEQVRTVIKVSKSLFSIGPIYDGNIKTGYDNINVKEITLWGVEDDGNNYSLAKYDNVVLTKDILAKLEKSGTKDLYLNAVVAEFRRQSFRFHTLTVVAEYGTSSIDLMKSLIGMVVSHRFQKTNSLSVVATRDQLKQDVVNIMELFSSKLHLPHTIADDVQNEFDFALKELYPIISMNSQGEIRLLHPHLFCALEHCGVIYSIIDGNTKLLEDIFVLVERMNSGLEVSSEVSMLGLSGNLIHRTLNGALPVVNLAKLISNSF